MPKQNGCAEKKCRHFIETGITFLNHANLLIKFWDYAFEAIVYTINLLPTPRLNHFFPYQKLFCEKPNYKQLEICCCTCYP